MKRIESTRELCKGMIVLTGTAYYSVTDISRRKFQGFEWDEDERAWGPVRDVPLPSPTCSAYEVTERHLFPAVPGAPTCYQAWDGYDGTAETVHERRADGSCACGQYRAQN